MATRCFDLEQLALVHQALGHSETLVSRGFHIPQLPSEAYPYEVVTLADQTAHERAPEALAHLVVYGRERSCRGVEHLYRICLQDDRLLARGADQSSSWLRALLVYVLTHELVHVVRFQRHEQSYLVQADERQREEEAVHRATLELLGRADEPHLHRLQQVHGNPVVPAQLVS